MPEAFAVLLVFIVAAGVYVGATIHARNPANYNARRELERLRGQEAWLQQRLHVAQQEKWSGDMIGRINDELGVTAQQLARVRGEVGPS